MQRRIVLCLVASFGIAWTADRDGTVRHFWQPTDATGAWVAAFDGMYVRRRDANGSDP